MVSGIKALHSCEGLVNLIYEYDEIQENYQRFSHPPIQVLLSPSENSELNFSSKLEGVDIRNLSDI